MSSEIVIKFLVAAVLAGTPFLFGTVGEILSEKVGHLNLGVEGMMSIGACAGFMVGYQTDNFVAALLAAAVLAGFPLPSLSSRRGSRSMLFTVPLFSGRCAC